MNGPMRDQAEDHSFFVEMREQILTTPLPARRRLRLGRGRVRAPRVIRSLPFAGAGMALAVAIAALVTVLGAGGSHPSPAYAVTVDANHTVTIYLRQLRAVGKLNARLAALHTRIRVVPIVHACVAPVHVEIGTYRAHTMHRKPGPAPGPAKTLEVDHVTRIPSPYQRTLYMTVETSTLPGRTLILPVTRSGMLGHLSGIGDGVVAGRAPRCVGDDGLHEKPAGSAQTPQ